MKEMTKRNIFKTYQTKPTTIEALPFNTETLSSFKALFPNLGVMRGYRLDHRLVAYDDETALILEENDYLLKDEAGDYYVLDASLFEECYQLKQPTLTQQEQELVVFALKHLAIYKRTEGWQADAKDQRYVASKHFELANQSLALAEKIREGMEG